MSESWRGVALGRPGDRRRPARWRLPVALALTVAVIMVFGTGTALAKSGWVDIADPDADTVVVTLSLAGTSYEYTWADLSNVDGTGDLGAKVTQSYLKDTDEQDPQQWTGVWLRTLLADVEKHAGIILDDDWGLKVAAVDGFVRSLFVGDVKDASNNYLLATDPVQGCTTEDPTDPAAVFYDPTYTRICTNGDYGNTAFPARLIRTTDSMAVMDANGDEIERLEATIGLRLTSPTASQARATIARRMKLALRAVATKAPGATAAAPVLWVSVNPKVATVAGNGTVIGKRPGTTVIRVTSDALTRSFRVKVVGKRTNATRVTLPRTRSLKIGKATRLLAKLRPARATNTVTWRSSRSAVATVDRSGMLRAVGKGRTTITVRTSNGKAARCIVSVR